MIRNVTENITQEWFYVVAGGTCPPPQIHLLPPDSKASWKNIGLYGVRIFPVSEKGQNGLGDEGMM